MVVDSLPLIHDVDRVFHALADSTRRDIVARTLQAEQSVSSLARGYPMSFAAVQKHVAVLETAGLVTKRRHGREQLVRGDIERLRWATTVLDRLSELWHGRVERMSGLLVDEQKGNAST